MVWLGEQVGNHAFSEAGDDEVPEGKFNVVRLMCPLVLVRVWVEELHVCM